MMKLNIGSKILCAAALIVLLAYTIFIFYFDLTQSQATTQSLKSKLQETGELASKSIENWVEGRTLMIENLGQNIAQDSATDMVKTLIRRPILEKTFMFSYLGTAQGDMLMFPDSELPDGYDPRKRPWYGDAAKAGASTLTEPYVDAFSGELIVTMASPVFKDKDLLGVVGGDIKIGVLVDIVRSLDLGGIGYAFLVNDQGIVLIHPDKEQSLKKLAEVYPDNTPSLATGTELAEHGDQMFAFFPVTGLPSVNWSLGFAIDRDLAYAEQQKFRTTAIIAAILSVTAIIVLLGLLVRKWVAAPVMGMTAAMTRLAAGEKDIDIPSRDEDDEIGAMAQAVTVFKENAIEMDRLASENEKAAERSEEERRKALEDMATAFEDEVSGIVVSVKEAASSLQSLAQGMSGAAETVGQNAENASSAALNITGNVEAVAASSEELSASVDEISRQVNSSSEQATMAANTSREATENVQSLSSRVSEISEVVGLISDIANQTNLLALNATIEAARAGDAGKGFAVVASEVKNLANQTAKATEQIENQINNVVGATEETVSGISGINTAISAVQETSAAIAAAIEEQGAATREIAGNASQTAQDVNLVSSTVSEVKEGAQSNVGRSQQVLTASDDLQSQAEKLDAQLRQFVRNLRKG
ncbi:methyl-accepting chemotaxis protein [Terasakiella sp. A23]|uniref:methyl-accepting chemotaxis protein n=1 Tax=Terasakiella sp. FCG-A23 TaxID=3080561 RepID=UPI0029558C07|nr:methyl-accepting chemotaxis protein [Terasakiella sp. A23]MDV7339183.1 methyl-accepting chemotaxis protein [Terasakiella sp. A23]